MRQKIIVVLVLGLILLSGLFSCKNNLLLAPVVNDKSTGSDDTGVGTVFGTPTGFIASHGIKGGVELSWEAVRGAARYNVYAVTNPSDTPVKIDSVAANSCTVAEKAGSLRYYRVTAVSHTGKETDPTLWQLGTTLARPQITSITPKDGEETSTVIVTWWMSNLFDYNETYEKSVKYKIFIKEEATDKELDPVDATGVSAEITGLGSKTKYVFRVAAYLSLNPQDTEESDWIDQETARRMKPQEPRNLTATQGTSVNEIIVSWNIPAELVEYPAGDGSFTTHSLFFKIYRRAKGDKVWNFVTDVKPTTEVPGDPLVWKDDAARPGLQYEYKVQSFAEVNKIEISSESSSKETTGWVFNKASFRVVPTRNTDVQKVSVGFVISWNNFGVNENNFKVKIKTEKKTFGVSGATWEADTETELLSFESAAKLTYVYSFDDEHYYRYILTVTETGSQTEMQESTSAQVPVTTSYIPQTPTFTVREGWADKIEIKWTTESLIEEYKLFRTDSAGTEVPVDITSRIEASDGSAFTFTDTGLVSGAGYTYKLIAVCEGHEHSFPVERSAPTAPFEFRTLGTPSPVFEESTLDYKTVTVSWKDVPLANADQPYKVLYNYEGQGNRLEAPLPDDFKPDNEGKFTLSFEPDQYDNANFSGKNIEVAVVAQSVVASSPEATVTARTLGPALIDVNATQAKYTDKIEVTWKAVAGANAYLITRTLVGSSSLKTDQYYIAMDNSVTLQAQPDPVPLTADFVAVLENDGTYTLTDKLRTDISSTEPAKEGYYERQSRMAWGNEYAYSVVPLKGTDTKCPVEYKYEAKPSATVLGYGLEVKATKARDARKVLITWKNPPQTPTDVAYTLYRAREGEQSFTPVNTAVRAQEVDLGFTDGMLTTDGSFSAEFAKEAYTYLVGIRSGGVESNPMDDMAFRKSFGETDQSTNFGYTLNAPFIEYASKGDNAGLNKDYAENIKWNAPVAGKKPRGAQGYEIEIRNYNLENNTERGGWYLLDTVSGAVPPSQGKAWTKDTQTQENGKQALKVLRDYKHYYRIRAYNGDGDDRVYSDYSNIEWSAREITNEEFTRMSLIAMSVGMYKVRGEKSSSKNGDSITGVTSDSTYNLRSFDYTVHITYTEWQSTLKPRGSNVEVASVIIDGTIQGRGSTAAYVQDRYWTSSPVTVSYLGNQGTVHFSGDGANKNSGSTCWENGKESGTLTVEWNGETKGYTMASKSIIPPLATYSTINDSHYRNDTEEWK